MALLDDLLAEQKAAEHPIEVPADIRKPFGSFGWVILTTYHKDSTSGLRPHETSANGCACDGFVTGMIYLEQEKCFRVAYTDGRIDSFQPVSPSEYLSAIANTGLNVRELNLAPFADRRIEDSEQEIQKREARAKFWKERDAKSICDTCGHLARAGFILGGHHGSSRVAVEESSRLIT